MIKISLYRVFAIILLAVLSLGALSGCAAKLPEGFDEAEVKTAAENVIELLNKHDSDGLTAIMNEEWKASFLDVSQWEVFTILEEAGTFQEITEMKTRGSKQNGISYAVVVVKAQYEIREITYTLSFDHDLKLAGLQLQYVVYYIAHFP